MAHAPEFSAEHRLPDGCRALSICESDGGGSLLQVAIVERVDGAGGGLVHIGEASGGLESLGGRACLGAVVDDRGYVHEWLEVWLGEAGEGEGESHVDETMTELQELLPGEWLGAGLVSRTIDVGGVGGGAFAVIGIRRYSPIRFGVYADVLGGQSWAGAFDGAEQLPHGETLRELSQGLMNRRLSDGLLTNGTNGKELIEVLYLKLRLIADAAKGVADFVKVTARPMLNLDAESFRIQLAEPGSALPSLWATRTVLARPGAAVPLPIEGSEHQYFKMTGDGGPSIYRPRSGSSRMSGIVMVRIREVMSEASDAIVIEGTLDTDEPLRVGVRDLIHLRLPVGGEMVNIFANVDPQEALTVGETRFRSVAQRHDAEVVAKIKQLAGVPIDRVKFEVVPLLTSAFDLYSLGVLAIRALLVDGEQTLAVAVDSILSLKRDLSEKMHADDPLAMAVGQLFHQDDRWLQTIGPQRLQREAVDPATAFDVVPVELWMEVIACIVRLFPGEASHSICRDLADAPVGGLHRVFEGALNDLEKLLVRVRSLIVVDWASNREMHTVIRRLAERL